jgi:tRNA threonylcarbamoyladenosine biosynthesis protein TsaE
MSNSSQMTVQLADAAATDVLGAALAQAFRGAVHTGAVHTGAMHPGATPPGAADAGTAPSGEPPDCAVLYLRGELGAGKTSCARSLLRSLGVTGLIRSPTFTLVEVYPLETLTAVHVDLYRVRGAAEVDELGLRDYFDPGCLLLIEWPEKGGDAVPAADLALTLEYAQSGRRGALHAASGLGEAWLQNLRIDTRLASYVYNLT